MNMDMQTLIIVIVVVLLIVYLLNLNQARRGNGGNYMEDGGERPVYDDPDIDGRGSFGRDRGGSSFPGSSGSSSRRPSNDSPNIRGRGSFGKDKR
jgi:hypothetical protein